MTAELLKAGWEIIKPAIAMAIQKLQEKEESPRIQKVIIALGALAAASDDIIKAIDQILRA